MVKKRVGSFLIAFVFFIISIHFATADMGCCVSFSDCDIVTSAQECTGEDNVFVEGMNCADVSSCNYGACCVEGLPNKLTTQFFCANISRGDMDKFSVLSRWSFDTAGLDVSAREQCSSNYTACSSSACSKEVTNCYCGSEFIGEEPQFCCALDAGTFQFQKECRSSPSCTLAESYSLSGTVVDAKNGLGINGVLVTARGKSTYTNEIGFFKLEGIYPGKDILFASAENYEINATPFLIVHQDIEDFTIQLNTQKDVSNEICDNLIDDDGDGAIDECDADCGIVHTNVLDGPKDEICTDGVDNDCDGKTDCADEDCAHLSICQTAYCGNGIVEEGENCENCPADVGPCPSTCGNEELEIGEACEGIYHPSTGYWEVTKPGECGVDSCGSPTSFAPCKCIGTCGNQKIEGGEDCDVNLFGQGNDDACPGMCSSDCKCVTFEECGDGAVTGTEECDASAVNGDFRCGTRGCIEPGKDYECTCKPTCAEDPTPSVMEAKPRQGQLLIDLEWRNEQCYHMVKGFYLLKCEGTNCTSFNRAKKLGKQTLEYVDEEVEPETEYCYAIETLFDSNVLKSKVSDKVCIKTGDANCYEHLNEFCSENSRHYCNETNQLVMIEDCSNSSDSSDDYDVGVEKFCLGPDGNGNTQCVSDNFCESCNSVFGMFFETGRTRIEGQRIGPDGVPMTQAFFKCFEVTNCYLDYTDTTIDKFRSCVDIDSCYDYDSRYACENDMEVKDGIAQGCQVGGCEWAKSDNMEFGDGICRPKEVEKQDCGACNLQESYDGNEVFDICTEERCKLYGECYLQKSAILMDERSGTYKVEQYEAGACTHKDEISCYDYSPEDCENSMKNPVYPNGTGVEIDDVTNNITTQSGDYFGFGVCRLMDGTNVCVKDADGDFREGMNMTWENVTDCGLAHDPINKPCQLDMTPPSTEIIHNEKIPLDFKLPAVTENNSRTYACLTRKGDDPCQPEEKLEFASVREEGKEYDNYLVADHVQFYDNTELKLASDVDEQGQYTLYYYSKDSASNLEVMKSEDIFIDPLPPKVKFINETESRVGDQFTVTNLTIILRSEDGEDMTCSGFLESGYSQEVRYPRFNLENATGTEFEILYPALEDGLYRYKYTCLDEVGNSVSETEEINIEADRSITNLKPYGTTSDTDITISAETAYPAECRYSTELRTFEYMLNENANHKLERVPNEGGLLHEKTLEGLEAGNVYKYYVACKFDNGDVTELNPSDMVLFAIDQQPPQTQALFNPTPYEMPETGEKWYNSPEIPDQQEVGITIKCEDRPIIDPYSGIDWSYGCGEVYYCFDEEKGCEPVREIEEEKERIVNYETQTQRSGYITFYGVDKGGYVEKVNHTEKILYDRVPATLRIKIMDGERQADTLSNFKSYRMVLTSSKPLQEGILAEYASEQCVGEINNFEMKDEDGMVWEAPFAIPSQAGCFDIESPGTFRILAVDFHNRLAKNIQEGKTFFLDTKPPERLDLIPPMQEYAPQYDYPLVFKSDKQTYYAGDCNLTLTGETEELLDIFVYQDQSSPKVQKLYSQKKTSYVFPYESSPLRKKGYEIMGAEGNKVYIKGDITNEIDLGWFMEISGYPRTDYGNYGRYYAIKGLEFTNEQDLMRTEIEISPALENPINTQKDVHVRFFDRQDPLYWFGLNLSMQPYETNRVYLKVVDEVGNVRRKPSAPNFFNIFCDPHKPKIDESSIRPVKRGVTSDDNGEIRFTLVEDKRGTGIDVENPNLIKASFPGTVEVTEREDEYNLYYDVVYSSPVEINGTVSVNVSARDRANNHLEYSWNYTVDSEAPSMPEIDFNVPSNKYRSRHFMRDPPSYFTVSFDDELPVKITQVRMGSNIFLGNGVECNGTGTRNEFLCEFSDEVVDNDFIKNNGNGDVQRINDHTLRINAMKELTGEDGGIKLGNPGEFVVDFIVDHTAPMPTRYFTKGDMPLCSSNECKPRHIRPGKPFEFFVDIMNEEYDLDIEMAIEEQEDATNATKMTDSHAYRIMWDVPELLTESEYPITIRYTDKAGNIYTDEFDIKIDTTWPHVDSLKMDVTNNEDEEVVIVDGEYFTRKANVVKFKGEVPDTDLTDIYAVADGSRYDLVSLKVMPEQGITEFGVNVAIEGQNKREIPNYITLVLEDEAGYIQNETFKVTKDLRPPTMPRFRITDKFADLRNFFN